MDYVVRLFLFWTGWNFMNYANCCYNICFYTLHGQLYRNNAFSGKIYEDYTAKSWQLGVIVLKICKAEQALKKSYSKKKLQWVNSSRAANKNLY